MSDENIALIRRFTDQGCVAGKLEIVDEVFADDYVDHDPMPGHASGREGTRQTLEMLNRGLSRRRMVSDEYLAVGDTVVQNATFGATHTGELLGVPASGKDVEVRGIEIWRVADGKVAERWGIVDVAGLLAQIGGLS